MTESSNETLLAGWGLDAAWIGPMLRDAPCGAIVFGEELGAAIVNAEAQALLGLADEPADLLDALTRSRVVKPGLLWRCLRRAVGAEVGPSVHVTESASGQVLFLEFRVCRLSGTAHVCWIRDLTDSQQLQQYRLFTEIGRIRDEKSNSVDLAHRLVDAILEFLAVDIAVLTVCERGTFRPIASRGMLLEPGRILDPEIHAYLRHAVATKRPVLADGSEWEPGEPMELTGVHYIVPLTAAGEIVGTLHLGSIESTRLLHAPDFEGATPSYTFDTLDTGFLEALSGYAGAALANVRLFEENQEERAKLRTLVQALPDGVVVYNSRGEIEIANAAAREISGVTWTNVNTDSRPYRLRTEAGRSISRSEWPFFRAVRGMEAIRNDTVIADFGDRERYIDVSVIPVPSADGTNTTYVGTMRDVTQRYDEQRRRELLLSVASHELRSPLTPLTGFLHMMRKQLEKGEPLDPDLVGRAEHQVSRMSRLIDTLLDVTRIESGKIQLQREPTDLRDVVTRTVDIWRAHPRGIRFEVGMPEHPLVAHIDSDRMDQVFANVIDNAVLHSSPGGRVEVALLEEDAQIVVSVRDHGSGIPAKVLPHVFERFYSMREERGGMGLGLYITHQIIEHHGGTITIDSVEGEWTCVRITLPTDPH